jgi:5-methylthioadenosine/S-adenosylhomocysteine deaminase
VLDFIHQYHHPDGLTTVCVAPSTLFLCTDDFLIWAGEQAQLHDLGMQIHVSETAGEVSDQLKETGHTPVEHLQQLGLLGKRLSAVHMVHVTQHDIDLLSGSGVQVVHCPKSNMKLADGIAPVSRLSRAGIPVSLGTDGCASNDLLDMWEEMRTAVLLARVSENQADVMTPRQAFGMATVAAASVARLPAGELEVGKMADLAVHDLAGIHLQPIHGDDLLNTLVFCGQAADVRHTIIHGEVVMRDRRITTVDEQSLVEEVNACAGELLTIGQELSTI